MNIKPLIQNISNFLFDRLVQLIGIVLTFLSIFILLALFTYSAEDPNFVFSNNNEINNIFGFQGSVVSDFLLQTMGLVSFLFSITLFITGINVVIKKRLVIILENFFYTILYIIFGTVFLGIFYLNSFCENHVQIVHYCWENTNNGTECLIDPLAFDITSGIPIGIDVWNK